jgi:hypothetical protein
MRQSTYSKLHSMLLALGAFAAVAAVVAPAYAENRQDDRHRHEGERHWRGHRDWDRGGVYVGPSYGYYGYGYPPSYGYGYPPPPVYYPQPGFSITIPLDIR